jgi:5-(carboxyamino)imidazole ribonucleotide mutase
MPDIGIIMGSDSDLETMRQAAETLDEFGASYEITVVSAHRTPERMRDYARSARSRGLKVIIAGAGGAAHLPGMTASMTDLPVIGVPVKSRAFSGVDSLLSIVQMPAGIPVATVAVDGARNAALLALRILGVADRAVAERLVAFAERMERETTDKAACLERVGAADYAAARGKGGA